MFFKNIFVPFDGSKQSIRALKAALHIAKKYDSKITVAYCIQRPLPTKDIPNDGKFILSIKKVLKKQAIVILAQAQKITTQNNFKINSCILESDTVVKKLVSFAKSAKMDSVIMGTHGKARSKGSVLGSVANGMSHSVHCPVLLVR